MGIGKKQNKSKSATELRRHAEERLRAETAKPPAPRTEVECQKLVHELEVHQIELEIQNAELSQARDDLETLLEKYTDLYDFAPVGYLTLDRTGTIQAVNLAGAGLLGKERSQLIGRRFGSFVAAKAKPVFTAFLEKVMAGPAKESCEIVLQKKEHRPLFVQIEALASRSGQECRVAIIDISQRKRLEEKLNFLNAELAARAADLEAVNIELEAFNSTVSHDLRQPLVLIGCYAQILQELCDAQLDERFREYLQKIQETTMHMDRRIALLLKFSCIAHSEIRRGKVDLSAMAQILATELKLTTSGRHVRFSIAEGIKVNADPELCSLVLENLIGNAWKFTGEQAEAVIQFGTTQIDGKPAFFVKDNGPGFEMADAKMLFIPFHRLPNTRVEGYGIGLATVQRIIQLHGGRVWTESAPGKGATFFFTLE